MKTTVFILKCLLFFFVLNNVNGQIKVWNDNWVSLGSLNKDFGVQIAPSGYTYFQPSVYGDFTWLNLTYATGDLSKCYIVDRLGNHPFFVYGNGDIYSRSIYQWSDINFKEDIKELDNPLTTVCKLHGVSFKYKERKPSTDTLSYTDKFGTVHKIPPQGERPIDTTLMDPGLIDSLIAERSRRHVGLIAQEVEKVAPDLVRTAPDGRKAIEYTYIIGLLIEATKEQNNHINQLKEEVKNLLDYQNKANSEQTKSTNNENESNQKNNVLYQKVPNPFSVNTKIRYQVEKSSKNVSILILNMQGTLLKSFENLNFYEGEIQIIGNEFNPGMYYYCLIVDGKEIDTKKMILTK